MAHQGDAQRNLHQYLLGFRIDKTKPQEHSHTSLRTPLGKFYIPSDSVDGFYDRYEAVLRSGAVDVLGITEKHTSVGPILIDIDLRFSVDQGLQRKYTIQHVTDILSVVFRVAHHHMDMGGALAYVMEKPAPRLEKNRIKDGFHIVIPSIVTTPEVQYLIRDKAIPLLHAIVSDIGAENGAEDAYDRAAIFANNWLMAGSGKGGTAGVYDVTHIFKYDADNHEFESQALAQSPADYVRLLSIRNKTWDVTPLRSPGIESELEKYRVRKRTGAQTRGSRNRVSVDGVGPSDTTSAAGDGASDVGDMVAAVSADRDQDYRMALELVPLLSARRAESYDDWMRVGWALHNVDDRLLAAWIDFSKRVPEKYEDGECERRWEAMRDNGELSMGSLRMWAAKDSPEEYTALIKKNTDELIIRAASGTHYDVALVVNALMNGAHVCVSSKARMWFSFHKHRWIQDEEGLTLSLRISTSVFDAFVSAADTLRAKINFCDDQESREAKQLGETAKRLLKTACQLRNSVFKRHVMCETTCIMRDMSFCEQLDEHPHLIGFDNGVYDLDAREFRDGKPEDKITFSTKYDYVPYSELVSTPEHAHLKGFLEQILPVESVRTYVLLHLASCLCGRIRENRFHIWIGCGSNGKSLLANLFLAACGDYAVSMPVSLLLSKRAASNAPTSELARCKGRRFCILQEPDHNEKLNVGLMKELSGGDRIVTRALYQDSVEWRPQFKLVLASNCLPEVSADDDGTWRRIRAVEFIARFTTNPDPSNPNEHLIDTELASRVCDWKHIFMSYLLDVWLPRYLRTGLSEPEEVTACTRTYQNESNLIGLFAKEVLVSTPGAFAPATTVYSTYKSFVRENYPDVRIPSKVEFVKALSRQIGAPSGHLQNAGWSDRAIVYGDVSGGSADF